MPEAGTALGPPSIVRQGIEEVVASLEQLGGVHRPLTAQELRAYRGRRIRSGWRLQVKFLDGARTLDVLIDHRFPRTPPRVALVDRPSFLTWPHIEEDGMLCVLPEGAEVDPRAPARVLREVLKLSAELIEENIAGLNDEDFRSEFLSYWNRTLTENSTNVRSLLNLDPSSRVAKVWRGADFYLLADTECEAKAWLERSYGLGEKKVWRFDDALFAWIDRPMVPGEYPKSGDSLRRLIRERAPGAASMLEKLVVAQPDQVLVVLGASTANGPCLAGVIVKAPRLAGRSRPKKGLTRGFRPHQVPAALLASRYFGGEPVARISVERADAAWIHGRDRDVRFRKLRGARVAILGCGSIGAAVAMQLAEAGVGSILLVDPETLGFANVGRHPLGVGSVGSLKAVALAKRISGDYPHMVEVSSSTERCEDLLVQDTDALTSKDLIVSAMGSWSAEGALNDWHLSRSRSQPIVYGWTEAYACAGHAVLVTRSGGCFGCGVGPFGNPSLRVTDWPQGPTQHPEPACGAVFQPYGPIELSHIVALIAELSVDALLEPTRTPTHRVWAARKRHLDRSGGVWTGEWLARTGHRSEGGFVFEDSWMADDLCPACRTEAT